MGILEQTVGVVFYHQAQQELKVCVQRGIIVHYVAVDAFAGLPI